MQQDTARIDVVVNLNRGAVGGARQSFTDPLVVSTFAASGSFPGRIKAYIGSPIEKDNALAADGFAVDSPARKMVKAVSIQRGAPRTVYVGRRDPNAGIDPDWTTALSAILVDAAAKKFSLLAFAVDERSDAGIEEISDFAESPPAPHQAVELIYFSLTSSSGVLNNSPGNIAETILAKSYDKTAMMYRNATIATGYGPAIVTSAQGPFKLLDGDQLDLRINNGILQSFITNGTPAAVTGSIVETYAISNGDNIIFEIDGGVSQDVGFSAFSAILDSGINELYNLSPGDQLLLRINGAIAVPITFNGTAGSVTGSNTEPFVVPAANLDVQIDGSAVTQTFNFTGLETTAQQLADLINLTALGFTASDSGGALKLTSDRFGAATDVEIMGTSDGPLLGVLGLVAGNNLGTGGTANIQFLDQTTALEAATQINNDTTGVTASDDNTAIRIITDREGTGASLQVTGGSANAAFLFSTNSTVGSGDFADSTAVTAVEVVDKLTAAAFGALFTVDALKVKITSKLAGTASKVEVTGGTLDAILGLVGATASGGGNVPNLAKVTADDLAIIMAGLVDGTASQVSSRLQITSTLSGPSATIVIETSGNLSTKLGWSSLSGTGTGTTEDYLECGWIGTRIGANLDAPDGKVSWDIASIIDPEAPFGSTRLAPADALDQTQANRLRDALKVNAYFDSFGVPTMGFGTILKFTDPNEFAYIDEQTTRVWLDVRLSEDYFRLFKAAGDAGTVIPQTAAGTQQAKAALIKRGEIGQTNGHIVLNTSELDPTNPASRGVTTPTVAGMPQADLNARTLVGLNARWTLQGAFQRTRGVIDLVVPQSEVSG